MSEEEIIKKAEYIIKNGKAYQGSITEYFVELYYLFNKEKEKNKELTERVLRLESDKFWNKVVSKDKIKAFIKEELPDDEICSYCETFDINGIDLKRKLQSLLEDKW